MNMAVPPLSSELVLVVGESVILLFCVFVILLILQSTVVFWKDNLRVCV